MDNRHWLNLVGTIIATTYQTALLRSMHSQVGSLPNTLLPALVEDGSQGNIVLQCSLSLLQYEVPSNGKRQSRNNHGACMVYKWCSSFLLYISKPIVFINWLEKTFATPRSFLSSNFPYPHFFTTTNSTTILRETLPRCASFVSISFFS